MSYKVMIADDDPNICRLYESAFTSRGYTTIVAQNGEETLVLIEKEKPDVVLLDIMMPSIHGLQVLDIVKSDPKIKDTKIIMFTALSDEKTKMEAKELGAIDYIVKSESSMGDILSKVQKVLTK